MSRSRLRYLEEQLERDDLTDMQWDSFNKEANAIQVELNEQAAKIKALREAQKAEEIAELELAKALSLTEEEVEKMYEDSCLKYQDVNGMSFRNWYEQSLKYYSIDAAFNVIARARSCDTLESIPHASLALAKLTILKRIKYKFYDHAVRGCDFRWEA